MVSYEKLRLALQHLEGQLRNHETAAQRTELSDLDREAIAESVIQRFETAYDVLWKTLKQHLIQVLGVVEIDNSPKPILRLAHANSLLKNDVQPWLAYADARTATAHDYSGEKAAETLAMIPAFLANAIALFETMTSESWT